VVIFNGLYIDNTGYGIYVENSDVTWYVDGISAVMSNDVWFAGHLFVLDGGSLTIDLVMFEIGDGFDGVTRIIVENGGTLDARNVVFDADGSDSGLFLVEGTLTMLSCEVLDWSELFLGPSSDAEISATNFMYNDRYGIHIDGSSPRIAGCLFSSNEMAGIFIEGEDAVPIIENCVFFMNLRGIYAVNSNLGETISNYFVLNTVAGIYAEGVTGSINANTFLLNKAEIFLVDSTVMIEDNELGYAHLIDAMSSYTPAMSVLINYAMDVLGMMNMSAIIPLSVPTAPTPSYSMISYVTSLLLQHNGIVAYHSTVMAKDNTYGLLSWAVYAEDSTIFFSDVVRPNDLKFVWLNSDMVQANLSMPVQAMDGIYARNSQVTIRDATIEVLDTAVFLSSSNANITNSKLLADKFDVYATGDSTVMMSGNVLDGKVKADGDATITVSFTLDVLTVDSNSKVVSGVKVVVKNAQGVVVAEGVSDSNGHFVCNLVAYQLINGNKDATMNPYSVSVEFKNGAVSGSMSMNEASALTVMAKEDNTALYVGIVVLAAVVLLIAVALMMRKK
jgi:hypothetical protein